jgi:hypothetical protein
VYDKGSGWWASRPDTVPGKEGNMVQLDLTPREAESLRKTLESYLSELRTEIAHTDSATYREGLLERKNLISRVTRQLAEGVGATVG